MKSTLFFLLGCLSSLAPLSRADLVASYTAAGVNNCSGCSNNPLAAEVDFRLSGSGLTITLTNTLDSSKLINPYTNNDALLAVFFGSTKVAATTGTATAPEMVKFNGTVICNTGNCDDSSGWAFGNLAAAQYSAMNGISAAGLGIFGPNGNFLPGPGTKLGGVNYGIVPTSYPAPKGTKITDGKGVTGPLEVDQSTFQLTLTGPAPTTLVGLESLLGTVTFQYGTSLSETHLTGTRKTLILAPVPEPSAILILCCTLGLAVVALRRRAA